MSRAGSWRNLELRVARYFEGHGYKARTNHKERGRSGLVHEIDVLAEKQDAAGTHRVAVECKAWRSPVEKDVIYKLEKVMQDTGLSKGIVVSVCGLRSGARVAAEQAHIEVWGQDEIRHYLGEGAIAGLDLALPDQALGVEVTLSTEAAEREVRKGRGGFAGIGAESIQFIELVWIPCIEFELAVTRVRPGLVNDREEVVRRWNLYEALTGRLLGMREEPRSFTGIALDGPTLRPQRRSPQIVSDLRKTLARHKVAKSDAAQKKRQEVFNSVGLPGSAREFAATAEKDVYVPFWVGSLQRKGGERFVAIHAGGAGRSDAVERALHEKVDVLTAALQKAPGLSEEAVPTTEPESSYSAVSPRAPAEALTPAAGLVQATASACDCGAEMVLRKRKSDGQEFWGCSTFPRCRRTAPMA